MDLLVEEIRRFDPDLVGTTVMPNMFNFAAMVTDRIHRELHRPVIWGGSDPTASVPLCQPHAAMICVGEGDEAIVEPAPRIDALWGSAAGNRWKIFDSIRRPGSKRILREVYDPPLSRGRMLEPAGILHARFRGPAPGPGIQLDQPATFASGRWRY